MHPRTHVLFLSGIIKLFDEMPSQLPTQGHQRMENVFCNFLQSTFKWGLQVEGRAEGQRKGTTTHQFPPCRKEKSLAQEKQGFCDRRNVAGPVGHPNRAAGLACGRNWHLFSFPDDLQAVASRVISFRRFLASWVDE